jgi:hypothetical protein
MAVVYFDQGPIAQALREELSEDRESEADEPLFFTEPPKKPEMVHPKEEVKEQRRETMSAWAVIRAYLLSSKEERKERMRALLIRVIKDDEDLGCQGYIRVLKQAIAALVSLIAIAFLVNLTAGVLVASILGLTVKQMVRTEN